MASTVQIQSSAQSALISTVQSVTESSFDPYIVSLNKYVPAHGKSVLPVHAINPYPKPGMVMHYDVPKVGISSQSAFSITVEMEQKSALDTTSEQQMAWGLPGTGWLNLIDKVTIEAASRPLYTMTRAGMLAALSDLDDGPRQQIQRLLGCQAQLQERPKGERVLNSKKHQTTVTFPLLFCCFGKADQNLMVNFIEPVRINIFLAANTDFIASCCAEEGKPGAELHGAIGINGKKTALIGTGASTGGTNTTSFAYVEQETALSTNRPSLPFGACRWETTSATDSNASFPLTLKDATLQLTTVQLPAELNQATVSANFGEQASLTLLNYDYHELTPIHDPKKYRMPLLDMHYQQEEVWNANTPNEAGEAAEPAAQKFEGADIENKPFIPYGHWKTTAGNYTCKEGMHIEIPIDTTKVIHDIYVYVEIPREYAGVYPNAPTELDKSWKLNEAFGDGLYGANSWDPVSDLANIDALTFSYLPFPARVTPDKDDDAWKAYRRVAATMIDTRDVLAGCVTPIPLHGNIKVEGSGQVFIDTPARYLQACARTTMGEGFYLSAPGGGFPRPKTGTVAVSLVNDKTDIPPNVNTQKVFINGSNNSYDGREGTQYNLETYPSPVGGGVTAPTDHSPHQEGANPCYVYRIPFGQNAGKTWASNMVSCREINNMKVTIQLPRVGDNGSDEPYCPLWMAGKPVRVRTLVRSAGLLSIDSASGRVQSVLAN